MNAFYSKLRIDPINLVKSLFRWRTCVGAAKGSLANAVGSMYVRKYFKEDAKMAALEMVHDIRAEFDRVLDEVDWMDARTRSRAKAKAEAVVEHIGYPPELLSARKLEDLYAGLELDATHYLGNALNMTVFGTNYAFSKLRERVNKTDWIRHGRPAVVNAFYSPLENSIQFPAGILQGIFFSNDRPRYMNYGAIGWVIGHEITHGFDDQGRQFDMEGKNFFYNCVTFFGLRTFFGIFPEEREAKEKKETAKIIFLFFCLLN